MKESLKSCGMKTERGRIRSRQIAGFFGTVKAKRILALILTAVLALVTAGCAVFPGTFPFGIAMVSAVSGVGMTLSAFIGAIVGCIRIPAVGHSYAAVLLALTLSRMLISAWLLSGTDDVPKPGNVRKRAGILSVIGTQLGLCRDDSGGNGSQALIPAPSNGEGIMLRENVRVRMVLSACAALFAGAWSVIAGGYVYYDLFGAVFSLLTTPLFTYLFYALTERKMRNFPVREAAVYFVCAAVTLALNGFGRGGIPGMPVFSFGCLFACGAVMMLTEKYGIHRGALAGLACGITMDPVLAPGYAAAAAVYGSLGKSPLGSVFAAVGSAVTVVAWAIFRQGLDGFAAVTPAAAAACALVIPLGKYNLMPDGLFGTIRSGGCCSSAAGDAAHAMDAASASGLRKRMEGLSEGLSSMGTVLGGLSEKLVKPGRDEMLDVTETAFDFYCRTCRLREKCGKNGGAARAETIRNMTDGLARDGYASASAVPHAVASVCFNIGRILDEVNLRAAELIRQRKASDHLATQSADYLLAGELLSQAALSERSKTDLDERLSARCARLLSYNDFTAGGVAVYGDRMKRIFVSDIDLTATRLGGEDIRRLFEQICGTKLTTPEFQLNGASLSMRMESGRVFKCVSGDFTCAASGVHRYYAGERNRGADCAEGRDTPTDTAHEAGAEDAGESVPEITVTDTLEYEPSGMPEQSRGGVSGDAAVSFEADGRFYTVISDGMGSGKEAALTSGVCVTLLEKLIRSGAELETALKMLNRVIRATGRETSTTVDIAEIDLVTGEARFVKSGAAPSFVLRDGGIFRLQSKTVPIGIIRALDAEMIKFDIAEGDTIVMVSDGAARSYEEVPWLLDMMTADETVLHGNEKEAAAKIVKEAARRGSMDDITCAVMRIRSA
ncbi:MAG: SpoIIE family protein phosphatase [Clostridia bacterium]|nr:SpoIIE family protein phosphatase [Clostridia bacterium]